MAGQESRHDGFDPFLQRETALVRCLEALSAIEKKRKIRAMLKLLRIEDDAIYCRHCGNKIYVAEDADLRNVSKKNMYGNAVDVFCAQCHTRLFFDDSEKVKSESELPQNDASKPPKKKEVPFTNTNSGATGNMGNPGNKDVPCSTTKVPYFLNVLSGIIIASIAAISFFGPVAPSASRKSSTSSATTPVMKEPWAGPEPIPEPRVETDGNTGSGISSHPVITSEIIKTGFLKCAAEFAININSDTTAVITTVLSNQLIDQNINPLGVSESFLIDKIREYADLDLRDAQAYKDALKCFLSNIRAL